MPVNPGCRGARRCRSRPLYSACCAMSCIVTGLGRLEESRSSGKKLILRSGHAAARSSRAVRTELTALMSMSDWSCSCVREVAGC